MTVPSIWPESTRKSAKKIEMRKAVEQPRRDVAALRVGAEVMGRGPSWAPWAAPGPGLAIEGMAPLRARPSSVPVADLAGSASRAVRLPSWMASASSCQPVAAGQASRPLSRWPAVERCLDLLQDLVGPEVVLVRVPGDGRHDHVVARGSGTWRRWPPAPRASVPAASAAARSRSCMKRSASHSRCRRRYSTSISLVLQAGGGAWPKRAHLEIAEGRKVQLARCTSTTSARLSAR